VGVPALPAPRLRCRWRRRHSVLALPDSQSVSSSVLWEIVGLVANRNWVSWPGPDRRTCRTVDVKVMMPVASGSRGGPSGRALTPKAMRMPAGLRRPGFLRDGWAFANMSVHEPVARPSTADRQKHSLADRLAPIFGSFGHRIPPFRRDHTAERVTSRAGPIAARKLEYTTTVGLVSKCRCNLVWHPAASVRPRSKVQPEANRSL